MSLVTTTIQAEPPPSAIPALVAQGVSQVTQEHSQVVRCRSCDRKFKTNQDLAAHILSKHGRVTLKPETSLTFCEESPSACSISTTTNSTTISSLSISVSSGEGRGGVNKKRRIRGRRIPNIPATVPGRSRIYVPPTLITPTAASKKKPSTVTVCTRKHVPRAILPTRKPLVLDFAQGLF